MLITDPPYARTTLPLYEDLAAFARTGPAPRGWLLCLTGWGIDLEVRQMFNASGLEFSRSAATRCPARTPRPARTRRPAGGVGRNTTSRSSGINSAGRPSISVALEAMIRSRRTCGAIPRWTKQRTPWEQNLVAFQDMIRLYTNGPDVILDPMMGWGTTLAAAVSYDRQHVIGIELLPDRYAAACQRLGLAPVHASGMGGGRLNHPPGDLSGSPSSPSRRCGEPRRPPTCGATGLRAAPRTPATRLQRQPQPCRRRWQARDHAPPGRQWGCCAPNLSLLTKA